MEKYQPNFDTLESVSHILQREFESFRDAESYFNHFVAAMRKDESFKDNDAQITRMSKIITNPDDEYETAHNSFRVGQLFGYNSLNKLGREDTYKHVYNAINSIYATARLSTSDLHVRSQNAIK